MATIVYNLVGKDKILARYAKECEIKLTAFCRKPTESPFFVDSQGKSQRRAPSEVSLEDYLSFFACYYKGKRYSKIEIINLIRNNDSTTHFDPDPPSILREKQNLLIGGQFGTQPALIQAFLGIVQQIQDCANRALAEAEDCTNEQTS